MTQTISVDTSGLVDGQPQDAADVSTPVGDLQDAIENVLNAIQEIDALLLHEIATPSNPAAGNQKLYVKSADNEPYLLDSAGVETPLGAAGLDARVTALENLPSASYELNEGSDYTTGSTSFVDVDGTNLSLTITTSGGPVLVGWTMPLLTGTGKVFFDVEIDSVREGGNDGIARHGNISTFAASQTSGIAYLVTGLSAASHTFKLQWKVSAGSATIFAGAGTVNGDVHGQFFVKELAGL